MTYIDGFFQEKEGNFGKFMKVALKYETLQPGEDWYVRFEIMPKKNPTEKSTHYGKINDWKPDAKMKTGTYGKQPKQEEISMEDIPFS